MTDLPDPLRQTMLGSAAIIAAAIIAALLILCLKPLLIRYALARPNARSSHATPTPQGGGIAVMAAVMIVAAAGAYVLGLPPSDYQFVLMAAAFMALLGAIDDISPIGVAPRLLFQALAVGIVIASLPHELRVTPFLPWWIERALLLVAGLWFVNLVNFMDGIDWITVAEVLPVTAGLVALSYWTALPQHGVIIALALFGAMLGFAPFNKPVARLFLGDVGSLPIGLLLGYLLVLLAGRGHIIAALLLPLYYLADATLTLLRRAGNGEKVWLAHRSHFYQRATDNGFTVLQIVSRIFAVNLGLLVLAALSVAQTGLTVQIATLAAGCALVAWLLIGFARGR